MRHASEFNQQDAQRYWLAQSQMRAALEAVLAAMEMQEKRQSGEFHINGETANCIWQDAKKLAQEAMKV